MPYEIRLEFGDVNVKSAIETKRRGQRTDDLSEQTVQVGVGGALDVEVAAADVVKGLVVDLVGDIGVLEERVDAQDGVVRLDHSGGDLRAAPVISSIFA